jgi:16S rRNA (uracil1498-N3)-methyltransferase|tara:strand:+ start:4075 stop:4767 length:693 start_codon:yes stop_codon:yes gene_type:complete
MQLFYHNKIEDFITLPKEESRHLIKVLRKEINDIIFITDGRGNLFSAKIILQDSKKCQLKILKKESQKKQHNYSLHIAIAPTKNMDRFEWFLEKATEIGVDEITPIICEKSERKKIKIERCEKIITSAMKQSLKFHKPKINQPILFKDFIKNKNCEKKYIASCNEINRKILKDEEIYQSSTILIGPEGDFTKSEVQDAVNNNFIHVSLGKSRLRTETAAIFATNIININF